MLTYSVVKFKNISYPFIRNNPTPTSNSQHNIQGTTRTPCNYMTCCFTYIIWEQKVSKFIHHLNYYILFPKKKKRKKNIQCWMDMQNYRSIYTQHKLTQIHLTSFLPNHLLSFSHWASTHLLALNSLAFPQSPNRPFSVITQSYLLAHQSSFVPNIYLVCLNRSFWVRNYLKYCLCTMPSTTEPNSLLLL